jgi:hypothetical protein
MIDRHGNTIRIGWAPHEDLWIAAANKLALRDRRDAYIDIAHMSGRSLRAVVGRAKVVATQERQKDREWLSLALKKDWESSGLPEAAARRLFVRTPTATCPSASNIGREPRQTTTPSALLSPETGR